ncbi:MAG: hypothetical protein R2754_06995 [Microthrixaceae bacterium]
MPTAVSGPRSGAAEVEEGAVVVGAEVLVSAEVAGLLEEVSVGPEPLASFAGSPVEHPAAATANATASTTDSARPRRCRRRGPKATEGSPVGLGERDHAGTGSFCPLTGGVSWQR